MASTELSPSVLKYIKHKHEERHKQHPEATGGFDTYLRNITAPESSAPLPINVDTSYPISHYFISSSHNTYLTGNQLWSKASTDPYKDVLKRGCRCIEIDVWDGGSLSTSSSDVEAEGSAHREKLEHDVKNLRKKMKKGLGRFRSGSKDAPTEAELERTPTGDGSLMPTPWRTQSKREEPRVLHGHTATKEIAFRDVCSVIRDYAFRTSDLPLIVSLEVHCTHEQQDIMVEIMTDYWRQYLVSMPKDFSDQTPLPTLNELRKKILIKVKYSPPETVKPTKKEGDEKDSSEDEGQVGPAKKGKIIEALSNLGVYARSCHFKSLDQPEASIPTHVFALSEQKLLSLQDEFEQALFQHNLNFFMRAYPKGTRVRSSNLDPATFWRQGIQMVALNWQFFNAAMMLNEAMFEGTEGWVLKPEGYRKTPDTQAAIRCTSFDLEVVILAAQNLAPEAKMSPNAFVKCELHLCSKERAKIPRDGKSKGGEWKRRSAVRHSRDPDFGGEIMEFMGVQDVVFDLSFVRIKLMDDDAFQKDKMLGWVCFRLDRFPQGVQLFQLKGADAKANGSLLLVESCLTLR